MMELENERKSFFESDADDNVDSASASSNQGSDNSAFVEQMKEWKAEQRLVFGTELEEEDLTGSSSLAMNNRDDNAEDPINTQPQDHDEVLEDQKHERDLLFAFSSHERAAWGSLPQKNSMQQILEEVAAERKKAEKGDSGKPSEDSADGESMVIVEDPHHESFSHVSQDGNSVHMVDVGHKTVTPRMAHAQTKVILPPIVMDAFRLDKDATDGSTTENATTELVGPKGPIFATAKIAGIMAAKNTSNLIPLCHPLPLDQVKIDIRLEKDGKNGIVIIDCTCRVTHKTGVEMEALTGASVAALTIYDMTKAVSHEICISETKLIAKTGGKRKVEDGVNKTQ
ncbi:MAG: hypothetical protein SGARI_006576 [Bacillariaceae sp.]